VWVPGELVFGTLVIVSNMKILISSYLISWWTIFFVFGSTIFYIICYAIISAAFLNSDQYGTLYMLLTAPQTYFTLILFTFMFVLVDTGLQYLNMYVNKWYLRAIERHKREQHLKDLTSKTVIRRKVTVYDSKYIWNPRV